MSVRHRPLSKRRRMLLASWRFWMDKSGRMHRVCRCEFCSPGFRRRDRRAFDWRDEVAG